MNDIIAYINTRLNSGTLAYDGHKYTYTSDGWVKYDGSFTNVIYSVLPTHEITDVLEMMAYKLRLSPDTPQYVA